VIVLVALAFQGSRGIWDPDEGRYTNVALEMLRTGDWVIPQMAPGEPHFTKPPLTYWAIASGVRLFGYNEWGARLAHALAFVLTALLVYALGLRMVPGRPWLPALIYLSSPMPFIAANTLTTDTLLTLWETLAMFGFISAWQALNDRDTCLRWMILMWLGYGLAFMTKGPPGLLPLIASAVFLLTTRGTTGLRLLFPWQGLLLFVLVGFSWYAWVIGQRPELLHYFLHEEVVGRVLSREHHNKQWYKGFTLYLPGLLVGGFPWILMSLSEAIRYLRQHGLRNIPSRAPVTWLLLLWVLLPLSVFMASHSKLFFYILPLFVPLSLLATQALQRTDWKPRHRVLLAVWLGLLLAIKVGIGYYPYKKDAAVLAREIRQDIGPVAPAEVVFIDRSPRYGLHLYFDAPLITLRLYLHGDVTRICQRLRAAEPRLWIVEDVALDQFERTAAGCGVLPEHRGHWRDMHIFLGQAP
jgi:4-amino-4-deoxy-L-arabinose transferase